MTLYRLPAYLAKAKGLRARRLGTSLAPVRSMPPKEHPQDGAGDPGSDNIKATRKHALITTPEQVAELSATLEATTRVALDLETTGLDPRQHRIRLLTLATDQCVWLVDCFEVDPRPLFPALAEKELVIHNALFDLGFLAEMGFELGEGGGVIDTMPLSQLLGAGREYGEDA
jgi:DNA polymerase III epsilon subunit-like protein